MPSNQGQPESPVFPALLRIIKRKRVWIPALCIVLYAWNSLRPVPPGLQFQGQRHPIGEASFLADRSWLDSDGNRQLDQHVFDSVFELIANAERLILLDMFLFNDFQGPQPETHRALSDELANALLQRKRQVEDLQVVVISDPINTVYGGVVSRHFEMLREAGIEVVLTDLAELNDSNPVYSFVWHWFIRPFGNSAGNTVPNPFGAGRVTIRSYLRMINFKANHRKVIVADDGNGDYQAVVLSANPHDGSSAHRNIALRFSGAAAFDLIQSENAVLELSGAEQVQAAAPVETPQAQAGQESPGELLPGATLQVVTEVKIKDALVGAIDQAEKGDSVDMLIFYLSERDVVRALLAAQKRGADVRVILDVNRDAFGRQKNGVPNKPVAEELVKGGVKVRWCATLGEQCHAKLLLVHRPERTTMLLGSANFTRRNLDNYNLETDIVLQGPASTPAILAATTEFQQQWENQHGLIYTSDYSQHRDASWLKRIQYLFMEYSGLSTF